MQNNDFLLCKSRFDYLIYSPWLILLFIYLLLVGAGFSFCSFARVHASLAAVARSDTVSSQQSE